MGDRAEKSIKLALVWLDEHPKTLDAGFVLPPLLARTDLGDHAGKAIELALLWLETKDFSQSTDAEFVLKHLLQKEQLPEDRKHQLIRISLERLEKNIESDEATFLIQHCMKSRLNDEDLEKDLFETAIKWLKTHQDHPEADYVFNRLLRRPRLSEQNWTHVAQTALEWLKSTPKNHPQRDYTLSSLNRRCVNLLDPPEFEYLLGETIKWIKDNKQGASGLLQTLEGTFYQMNMHHPRHLEIKMLLDPHFSIFRYHLKVLISYFRNPDIPIETNVVHDALNEFKKRTELSPSSAGSMIPALLAIAIRLDNELTNEIRETVSQTISDEDYEDNKKRAMLRACLQMIKDGKISPKEKALQMLSDFMEIYEPK